MIVQSTFIWANYLLSNSPYCMIYLCWETGRENWSWSLLGVKGLTSFSRYQAAFWTRSYLVSASLPCVLPDCLQYLLHVAAYSCLRHFWTTSECRCTTESSVFIQVRNAVLQSCSFCVCVCVCVCTFAVVVTHFSLHLFVCFAEILLEILNYRGLNFFVG